MIKVDVRTENMEGFDAQFREIVDAVNANLELVAEYIHSEAKSTLAFKDKTKRLRKSIRIRKSKYMDGGFIVVATGRNRDKGYHAWLVEFGHIKFLWGEPTGERVPPHAFMRPAKEKGLVYAVQLLRSNVAK